MILQIDLVCNGTALKLTFKGINTKEVVDTKLVELIVTPGDNQAFEPFKISPYVKKDLNVGADVISTSGNIPAPSSSRPSYILLWKHWDDTWTGCVSCHPPVRVFRC